MPFFHRLPRWIVIAMLAEAALLIGAAGLFGRSYWPASGHEATAAIRVPEARPSHDGGETPAITRDKKLASAKVEPIDATNAKH